MGLTSGGSKVPESRVCYGFYAWQVVCAFYSIDNFGRGCWECEKKKNSKQERLDFQPV